ncbi:MAG: CoA protein activase [Asgard group archaeon]|nr:CoA protein activase [Asgard group archaeon]
MPFTFPHFGSLKYVFEVVLKELGREDILPPIKPSKKTRELGSRYSPEFVCTPFKLTLGTFIEMLDMGADQLGMGGGNVYCRFGWYWPVQKLILEDLGYDFKFFPLFYDQPIALLKQMKNEISNGCNLLQTIRALRIAWLKNRLTDITDKMLYKYRAIENEKGATEELATKIFREIVEVKGIKNIKRKHKTIPERFENEIDYAKDINPIRVAVNGEIYVVLEPALNLDVHRKLNNLGVIVDNPVTLRRFIDIGMKLNPFKKMHWKKSVEYAKDYVQYRVGGETRPNLGDIIYYKKAGFDGLVHLYPFTCMPEIITRSICNQMSREYNMPVLSLVVDEHTGEAGFQTRVEAFVDLLRRKR